MTTQQTPKEFKNMLKKINLSIASVSSNIKLAEKHKNHIYTPHQKSQTDILLIALMIQLELKNL